MLQAEAMYNEMWHIYKFLQSLHWVINDNLLRKKNIFNITTTFYAAWLSSGRNCLTLHTIHLPNMLEAFTCLPAFPRQNQFRCSWFIYFKVLFQKHKIMCDLQDNVRSTDTDQSPKNKTVAQIHCVNLSLPKLYLNLSTKSPHIYSKTARIPNLYCTI